MQEVGIQKNIKSIRFLGFLITLIFVLTIYLNFTQNTLRYTEVWVSEPPLLSVDGKNTEEEKSKDKYKLLEILNTLKSSNIKEKNDWKADRRYKSSFVYIEAKNKQTMDNLYDNVKPLFANTIVRILPQNKVNALHRKIVTLVALILTWALVMSTLFNKRFTIYITLFTLLLTLGLNSSLERNKKWINQVEHDIKKPEKTSKLTYDQIQSITDTKGQLGEITTRILEGKNSQASFKMKSTHRIYNQKGKRQEAYKIWIRSDAPTPTITSSLIEAELILKQVEKIFSEELKNKAIKNESNNQ